MLIRKSTAVDIDEIFKRYDEAIAYQMTMTNKGWRGFEKQRVLREIEEGRHFIIEEDGGMACTFLITFSDPVIWKGLDEQPAVYLHRIATNPLYRGNAYVEKIVAWAKDYAKSLNIDFIRLDTMSGNERINAHYQRCGFTYKGINHIEWTADLPEHYKEGPFSLFEIDLR